MKKRLGKSGQMKMSFGMIFSIILVIVFLAFAFWGITKFLGVQQSASVGQFKNDFQEDVDQIYLGPQGQQEISYNLPNDIERVCFEDDSYENLRFEPRGEFSGDFIEHIDMEKTLEDSDNGRICFDNVGGEISITLRKDFGENEVTLTR